MIGRWGSVDPLAFKYPAHSPYNYVLNNPVKLTDPNGEDIWDIVGGAVSAISDNAVGTNYSQTNQNYAHDQGDFSTGQTIGNVISVIGGAVETAAGAITTGAGIAGDIGSAAISSTG